MSTAHANGQANGKGRIDDLQHAVTRAAQLRTANRDLTRALEITSQDLEDRTSELEDVLAENQQLHEALHARTARNPIVILESPYAGEVEANIAYAKAAMLDSLMRGEAPMVSHLLYTQVLDDTDADQRKQGIDAGLAWRKVASRSVVYTDRGISKGMEYGIKAAQEAGIPVEYRTLSL